MVRTIIFFFSHVCNDLPDRLIIAPYVIDSSIDFKVRKQRFINRVRCTDSVIVINIIIGADLTIQSCRAHSILKIFFHTGNTAATAYFLPKVIVFPTISITPKSICKDLKALASELEIVFLITAPFAVIFGICIGAKAETVALLTLGFDVDNRLHCRTIACTGTRNEVYGLDVGRLELL